MLLNLPSVHPLRALEKVVEDHENLIRRLAERSEISLVNFAGEEFIPEEVLPIKLL